MPIDRNAVLERLKQFDFSSLFTQELGWDWGKGALSITVREEIISLDAVAEKRGVQVFVCPPDANGHIPPAGIRATIDREVTKLAYEHLIIFIDNAKTEQLWVYPRRDPGRPVRLISYHFDPKASNEALLQKLSAISFSLNEEEGLTLFEVTDRLRETLNRDKLTKSFFQRFAKERDAFQNFLEGIPDKEMAHWYVAVLMNRLMFIYFIQAKGFLDGRQRYLQEQLENCTDNYYRKFLSPLFFQGLAVPENERTAAAKKLLGRLPYLNGGIFQQHQIEKAHGKTIEISNEAFEALFAFFDDYRWHLDERPLAEGNEINPDVLGYIFEKYINQKQMGAYYTKEDITEYISKNTIIPFLFDTARKQYKPAFESASGPTVWDILKENPDAYIYPAVRHGITWDYQANHPDKGIPLSTPQDIPPEIAKGISPPSLHDPVGEGTVQTLELRKDWNQSAPPTHALPTETWRELIARRQRYDEIKARMANGDIREINDLITLNLDIRQFAQDVIDNCDEPDLLRALWHTLEKVTILDPTCGSGAFLFAALNILEPLYGACLDRMEAFLSDEQNKVQPASRRFSPTGTAMLPHKKLEDFTRTLDHVAAHPNRRYFIFKSIILNNLYGVDIMEEAVEICKLRLFLKLAAQVDPDPNKPNFGVEPLPDIDFNIKAGNTLVGFANKEQLEETLSFDLLAYSTVWPKIKKDAEDLQQAFDAFRQRQVEGDGSVPAEHKLELQNRLAALEDELNRYLAVEYGIEPTKKTKYAKWLKSHQPFHWFIEFFGIMDRGGFDVIIGNPPYKELRSVADYKIKGLTTTSTKNLYPLVMERCLQFSLINGRLGFIVPVSSISTRGYMPLQDILLQYDGHFSSYDDRPSRLFDGLEHIQLTIHLIQHLITKTPAHYITECYRWSSAERPVLFERLLYEEVDRVFLADCLPKISFAQEHSILRKIWGDRKSIGQQAINGNHNVYYSRKVHNFLQVLDFVPQVYDGKDNLRPPTELKNIPLATSNEAALVFCLLNTSLFRWFINVFSDCRHVNKREVEGFRIDFSMALKANDDKWIVLAEELSKRLCETAEFRRMRFKHDYLRVQCIIPKLSKNIIDRADRKIGKHYGFTEEELDFIVNYAIKYRMGREAAGGSDDR